MAPYFRCRWASEKHALLRYMEHIWWNYERKAVDSNHSRANDRDA